MALVLPNSVVLHTPKTGGWWVRNAIKAAGLTGVECGHEHESFKSGLLDRHHAEWWRSKLTIVFVRHPVRWYQSLWAFRMKRGWAMAHPLDYNCASNDFNEFVRNVIEWCPEGWVGKLYSEYVDHAPVGVRVFVGRQERLSEDLTAALNAAGEEFDGSALTATCRANDGDMDGVPSHRLAEYDEDTLRALTSAEDYAIGRWYGPFWEGERPAAAVSTGPPA